MLNPEEPPVASLSNSGQETTSLEDCSAHRVELSGRNQLVITRQPATTSHPQHSPNKIIGWLNRLQSINESSSNKHPNSAHSIRVEPASKCETAAGVSVSSLAPAAAAAFGVPIKITSNNGQLNDDKDDVCFKAAQLVTELLLMFFAASLLCIVAIVILSKKIPTFMESYEIVPKALFFLCIFVAACSFIRWIALKFWIKVKFVSSMMKCCSADQEAKRPLKEEPAQPGRQKPLRPEEGHSAASGLASSRPEKSSTSRKAFHFGAAALDPLEQRPFLAESQKRRHPMLTRDKVAHGKETRACYVIQTRSCPPPTRQAAFDSSNLHQDDPKVIEEEPERPVTSS